MSNPIEGWYPDPEGTPRLRWWDGTGWTDDYRTEASYDAPSPNVSRFAPTIDPVTGTTSHPITGVIDPFTGSVARPVTSTGRFAPTIEPDHGQRRPHHRPSPAPRRGGEHPRPRHARRPPCGRRANDRAEPTPGPGHPPAPEVSGRHRGHHNDPHHRLRGGCHHDGQHVPGGIGGVTAG